jgi:hypothetical protein
MSFREEVEKGLGAVVIITGSAKERASVNRHYAGGVIFK